MTTIDEARNLATKLKIMENDPIVTKIVDVIKDKYLVTLGEMRTPNRKHYVRYPRYLCIGLIREHTKHSLTVIGMYFHRTHATVLNALTKLHNDIRYDINTREDYERVSDMLISIETRKTRRIIFEEVLSRYVTDEVLAKKWLNKYIIAD